MKSKSIAIGIIVLWGVFFALPAYFVGRHRGEYLGSERVLAEWRDAQQEVRSAMQKAGACDWAIKFQEVYACPRGP